MCKFQLGQKKCTIEGYETWSCLKIYSDIDKVQFVVTVFVLIWLKWALFVDGGRLDRIIVGFTSPCAISAYHHLGCEFEPCSWRGVLDTTLCDKVCQWLATGWWFSPGTPVFSTNKADRHVWYDWNIVKL